MNDNNFFRGNDNHFVQPIYLYYSRIFKSIISINLFVFGRAMTVISVALGRTFHYVDELLPFRFFLYLCVFIFEWQKNCKI